MIKINKNIVLHYHFRELKLRTSYLVFSFLTCFFTCYFYYHEIIFIFINPFLQYSSNFIFTNLNEAFYTSLEIAFFLSLYLLIPIVLYHIWCFSIPSKFVKQRKKLNSFFIFSFVLLIVSVITVYFFVLPNLYEFLLNFKIDTSLINVQLEARIHPYVKLACKILIVFTLLFQFIFFFFLLIQYNLINLSFLAQNRSKIFLVNFIFASLISPPDILLEIIIGLCFQFIMETIIILSFFLKKLNSNS